VSPRPAPSCLKPNVHALGREWSSFQICGCVGLALGTTLALVLAGVTGLSGAVVVVLLSSGVFTFLVLAMATQVITGRESLVYYHHEVAILSVSGVLLATVGLPVRPYLDVTALGLGVFLTCGRCGCLMVGCCHGKPSRWGIRYGEAHAREGFPAAYVGARLFPVQALEAAVVATIVSACSIAVVFCAAPGAAVSSYVACYSAARIWLEELRGDGTRPYWMRLSEAQWTSLVLILAVCISEWRGRLPWTAWHGAVLATAAASLALIAWRRTGANAMLIGPHAGEIAEIVKAPSSAPGAVAVRRTSAAIGLSAQPLVGAADAAVLYSISRAGGRLTPGEARSLAGFIFNLTAPADAALELVRGAHDVFHVIIRRVRGERPTFTAHQAARVSIPEIARRR
jgi:prolipoprotein diacylglyceryltransferase